MMKLNIPLPGRAYDILIESSLLARAGEHCRAVLPRAAKLAVVTDSNVAPLYAQRVKDSLEAALPARKYHKQAFYSQNRQDGQSPFFRCVPYQLHQPYSR